MGDVSKKKIYQKNWFMWVTLIFFAPVGIFLMWKYNRFNKVTRSILTVVFSLFFIFAIVNGEQEKSTQKNKISATMATETTQKNSDIQDKKIIESAN